MGAKPAIRTDTQQRFKRPQRNSDREERGGQPRLIALWQQQKELTDRRVHVVRLTIEQLVDDGTGDGRAHRISRVSVAIDKTLSTVSEGLSQGPSSLSANNMHMRHAHVGGTHTWAGRWRGVPQRGRPRPALPGRHLAHPLRRLRGVY